MYTDTECLRAPDIGSEDCFWKMIFGHLVGVLKCPLWLTILPLNVLPKITPRYNVCSAHTPARPAGTRLLCCSLLHEIVMRLVRHLPWGGPFTSSNTIPSDKAIQDKVFVRLTCDEDKFCTIKSVLTFS